MGADPAVRVSVPAPWAEVAGAVLFDLLGPFQEVGEGEERHFLFYPFRSGAGFVPDEDILALLPADSSLREQVVIERVLVPGGWEEGWKEHFRPLTVKRIYVRPPWERPPEPPLVDLTLTPGLAFGTGLHPTTRGMLELLQDADPSGRVLDAGTGSGILAIAAALLGWGPVRAFDNDPLAVEAARTNAAANGAEIEVNLADVSSAPVGWFEGVTVLANMTLEPVSLLLERLEASGVRVRRLLVAGILSGEQEHAVGEAAARAGLRPLARLFEKEWVSFAFRSVDPGED